MRAISGLIVSCFAAALGSAASPASAGPSFDCARAETAAEKLVCGDTQLAALDLELARLYRLALTQPRLTPVASGELTSMQRGWIKGRDDCWKADDQRACVLSSYGLRILELRQGFSNTRTQDETGISFGPFSLACEGLDFAIGTVFVNPDPSIAVMSFADRAVTLVQQISASGVRYLTEARDGHYLLWTKGNEARLELPGKDPTTCRIDETG